MDTMPASPIATPENQTQPNIADDELTIITSFVRAALKRLDHTVHKAITDGRLTDDFDLRGCLSLPMSTPWCTAEIYFDPQHGNAIRLTVMGDTALLQAISDHFADESFKKGISRGNLYVMMPSGCGMELQRHLAQLPASINPKLHANR